MWQITVLSFLENKTSKSIDFDIISKKLNNDCVDQKTLIYQWIIISKTIDYSLQWNWQIVIYNVFSKYVAIESWLKKNCEYNRHILYQRWDFLF